MEISCASSCDHIYSYKCTVGLDSYEILHAFYVSCIAKDSRHRKSVDCVCKAFSCQTRNKRIHACLSCVYFGCFSGGHIHEHARIESHALAVDTNFGHVYCFKCEDYQYDADFDRIAQKQKIKSLQKGEVVSELKFKWLPSAKEVELLRKHVVINLDHIKGPRGIRNLGNTCYMSVVIFSLVHAPVFRDYFLTLKHKCNIQSTPSETQVQVSDQLLALEKLKPVCFVCEMSKVIQEFFCGKLEPFNPDRLLYLLWIHAGQFRGVGQHDAHEFFGKLLDFLHLHRHGQNENISSNDNFCNCIIDSIFTISLRLDGIFENCNHKFVKVYGQREIVLQGQSSIMSTNNDTDGDSPVTQRTLSDLIKGTLSEVKMMTCSTCNETRVYNEKMTLNKLPIILTLLQQSDELLVSFPEFLDMTPFMTTSSKKKDKSKKGHRNISNNMYYLFAVVVHKKSKEENGGHYISYVRRHRREWFLMDDLMDDIVTQVTLQQVLSAPAVMLFYHKEILEYEDREKIGS